MKTMSRHTVSVETEIPADVFINTSYDMFSSSGLRALLTIQASSDESAEVAEQLVLETVERIIQAVKA